MGTIASFAQTLNLTGVFTKALDLSTPNEPFSIPQSQVFIDGSSANQVGSIWHDTITLDTNNAYDESLDLAGDATFKDAFGDAITFTTIKVLYIHNRTTTSGYDLTISGTFINNNLLGGADSTIILGPGGVCLLTSPVDGFAVSAGDGDILTLDSVDSDVILDIFLAGTV